MLGKQNINDVKKKYINEVSKVYNNIVKSDASQFKYLRGWSKRIEDY